jgi:hypothetical protein
MYWRTSQHAGVFPVAESVSNLAARRKVALFRPPDVVTGTLPLGVYVGPDVTLQFLAGAAGVGAASGA